MAHFANIVEGIVQRVIVAEQDFVDTQEGTWVQTSYNTHGGVHWTTEEEIITIDGVDITHNKPIPSGGVALRKNYAGVGFIYDADRDAFYPPQPYASWELNESTCCWEAPIPYPNADEFVTQFATPQYNWDESTTSWVEVE
jgi:hypothetical protein|tara:strand:- start:8 stop:430 length:423 start_codon:yes stop_codon:yes gene_type:complete